MLGARVWDHQSKFRIHLGPLTLAQYEAFLPAARAGSGARRAGALLRKLVDWVRFYLCFELDWDVRLALEARPGPAAEAGTAGASLAGRRGWARGRAASDAADLCLDGETFVTEAGVA